MNTNKNLEAAIAYRKMGFSVIPVGLGKDRKRPYSKWERYQKEIASEELICIWWKQWPQANVGIVTGKISGFDVIDVDSNAGMLALDEYLSDSLTTPTARTPNGGWHFYFKHTEGLSNAVRFLTDCDVRSDGGYVVAPPSVGANGKPYNWVTDLDYDLADLPEALPEILKDKSVTRSYRNVTSSYKALQSVTKSALDFNKGSRDSTLFHVANHLVKSKMPIAEIEQVLEIIAYNCNPPFPKKEVAIKIKSALKRAENREGSLHQEIFDWVSVTKGSFSVTDCDKELGIVTKSDKANRRVVFHRLVEKDNILERDPKRQGYYRKIENDRKEVNFMNASTEIATIDFPFGIGELVDIMPGEIVLVAGEPNAGKTAFLLNIIKKNMNKAEVHYFSSEMGAPTLRRRLEKFDDIALRDWKFKAWERSSNFADVVYPGKGRINVIDFLEMYDNFYEMGGRLAEIFDKLDGAIAVVAIQKNRGTDIGLGGIRGLEKPSLYLSIEPNMIKIIKAKHHKTDKNPNGLQIEFKVAAGCVFTSTTGWHKEDDVGGGLIGKEL